MVLFSDYLQESRTQQDVLAPEPVPLVHKKKEKKSKRKKDQPRTCLKVKKVSHVPCDRLGKWACRPGLFRRHRTFSYYSVSGCLKIVKFLKISSKA